MATGLITVGRRRYVSGLYWENSPSGRVTQAAKEAASQPGHQADYFATRAGDKKGRVPQFGLATTIEGLKSGLPSLAGCMANQQPGSWIGAFTFREGTAVVIIRDDLIVPEGDLFFQDEIEARDRLYQEIAIGGFQKIYAPEAWGIPGADSMPVGLLLNDRTDVKLRAVALSKEAKLGLAIVLGILGVILIVGWYLQNKRAEEERMRLEQLATLQRMQAEAAKLVPGMQKVEYPPPVRYWEKEPHPLELINACQEALQKVPVGVAGWRIANISCSRGALSLRWVRTGGFSKPPDGARVNDTGQSATSSVDLPKLADRGDEALVDPDIVTHRYLAQDWTGSIKREPDDPPPPPPPGYKGEWNPPPPPWIKRSFTFYVPVLPWTLPEFLTDLPGVIVKGMMMNGDGIGVGNKWTVNGVIYENRR